MSHRTIRLAERVLEDYPEKVWCSECQEETNLGVEDNSFGHEFGTEYIYDIVTCCCGAYDWSDLQWIEICSICGKRYHESEMVFQEEEDRLICKECDKKEGK